MKKNIAILISSLFLTVIMQAQDRTQPKPGPSPKININKPETFTLPNGTQETGNYEFIDATHVKMYQTGSTSFAIYTKQ